MALEARRFGNIERIYGARHGVRGIVNEDFVDLTQETSHNLELVAATPSSALGSTRDKPDWPIAGKSSGAAGARNRALLLHRRQRFVRHGAHRKPGGAKAGYPLRSIHIPKTIDNDLVGNDHTPGFPSAARFVAQAFAGANLDNAALPGVYVGVVMGAPCGLSDRCLHAGQSFPTTART
ncbi:MAG: 6-phosphofructokinase [Comamonadaceae bacterium]|uniref:6-phosphofructokinase n=1 Tax=Candidatus Skiveiella danica TaxID=3386177 RepID=UPI00390C0A81|nr:6-phosphofructokinase [Comamonadaceae bacterium]